MGYQDVHDDSHCRARNREEEIGEGEGEGDETGRPLFFPPWYCRSVDQFTATDKMAAR
jgi:hypothetical protein